jgi:hypothetical protein
LGMITKKVYKRDSQIDGQVHDGLGPNHFRESFHGSAG